MRLPAAPALGLAIALAVADGFVAVAQRTTSPASPGSQGQPAPRPPAAAAARRDAAVPFAVGETLTYDVSWSSILTAGTAVVTVVEKKPSFNSTAYSIVAEGKPVPLVARLYALYYKMDTLLDTGTLLPHRGSLYAEEGKARRTSITQFDRAAKKVFFEEQSESTTKLNYPVPADTQDGLSALYALRTRTLRPGDRVSIQVADSGTLFSVEANVGSPEVVKVAAGSYTAVPLAGVIKDADGQPVWKNIVVWLSTDARRLPVKLQAELPVGAFVLALSGIK